MTAVDMVRSHLGALVERGRHASGMWASSLDSLTGESAPPDEPRPVPKRVYRNIDAPGGANLYWDMPLLVAAHAVARLTGEALFAEAADEYVSAYLSRCVAKTGVVLWGNHYYFDFAKDSPVRFVGVEPPVPCEPADEDGALHEARPLPPAWECVHRVSPEAAETCVRELGRRHVFDAAAGGFNRHADGKRGCAFLEAGGVLVESLAWLFSRTRDRESLERAMSIARFSFAHRGGATGLVENNPTVTRWDKHVTTTELGLWAGSLLRAADLAGDGPESAELAAMARDSVLAYVERCFEPGTGLCYGKLKVADGSPSLGESSVIIEATPDVSYYPADYADFWEPLFPRHDYPAAMAETCVALWERTGEASFADAARKFARNLDASLPARGGRGAYAEHYGRAIRFLARAKRSIGGGIFTDALGRVRAEAVEQLWRGRLFRGHPGEDRADAVDGIGMLAIALIEAETGEPLDLMGFGF